MYKQYVNELSSLGSIAGSLVLSSVANQMRSSIPGISSPTGFSDYNPSSEITPTRFSIPELRPLLTRLRRKKRKKLVISNYNRIMVRAPKFFKLPK
jgi:hypothetical protein